MQKTPIKQKILIADDSDINRDLLTDMLGDSFEILEAKDGLEAVQILKHNYIDIDLLLLDVVMPNMDGFEVLAVMNKNNWLEDVSVIMISAENSRSYIERAYELGVVDFISRPFDASIVKHRVINTLMLNAKKKKLVRLVTDQIYEKEKSNSLMINILSHIVEFRNGESGLHVLHISSMTKILLNHLIKKTDRYKLTYNDINLICIASALHDIGKIAIPNEILNKPGRFTPEEYAIMKTHASIGASMLEALPHYEKEPLVKVAYEICRWHHERYDGRGYPDGLKGEDIPISAQIVALADVYDALTSQRVYKKAIPHDEALKMILNGECGAFNPILLECLEETATEIQAELQVNSLSKKEKKEIENIVNELSLHEELSSSKRTIEQLENERTKFEFLASISKEIQFQFSTDPSMLTLNENGAKIIGLNTITMNPLKDSKINELLGDGKLLNLREYVFEQAKHNPVVKLKITLNLANETKTCEVACLCMVNSESIVDVVGKIFIDN